LSGLYKCEEAEEEGQPSMLKRLDEPELSKNEWIEGNQSPILAGGGSVDSMTGGIVSTAADYARFCLMLLGNGELGGARVLQPATVEMLTTNQLPAATGSQDCWTFGAPGTGFGLVGSVSVAHPELDAALRPGEYGWGGMAGTAWTNDPAEDFMLLSFSLVAFDVTSEEELRAGVRAAIAAFDETKSCPIQTVTPVKRRRGLSFWGLSSSAEKLGCSTPRKRRGNSLKHSSSVSAEKLCSPIGRCVRRRIVPRMKQMRFLNHSR